MSIQEIYEDFKHSVVREAVIVPLIILVVAVASFALGRMSAMESVAHYQPIQAGTAVESTVAREMRVEGVPTTSVQGVGTEPVPGGYVASKNGTKYHLPWCSGAKRIKEENKIWFSTKEEAEKAGYEPAGNCKGI